MFLYATTVCFIFITGSFDCVISAGLIYAGIMSTSSSRGTSESERHDDVFLSDNELQGLKKKLDDDIQQMENHMRKWRTELFEPGDFSETSYRESRSSTTKTTTSKTTYYSTENEEAKSPKKSILKHWPADNLNGPLRFRVERDQDSRNASARSNQHGKDVAAGRVRFTFDLGKYHAKEIRVRIVNDKLLVHAKREKITDNKSVGQEYNREVILPADVDPESATSVYSKNGVLVVDFLRLPQIKRRSFSSSFYKAFNTETE